jgi:hypothetical protein
MNTSFASICKKDTSRPRLRALRAPQKCRPHMRYVMPNAFPELAGKSEGQRVWT